jgi:quercetin 2,3-dioxygenase
LDAGEQITYDLPVNRSGWLQVAQGIVRLNGEELRAGDGVEMPGGQQLAIETFDLAELLLFDLA